VEWLQDEFEADSAKEFWMSAAAEALGTGEVSLRPLLDAWVEASPSSFAPVLARGTHWVSNAFLRRGARWANETPDEDMRSMEEAAASGLVDLERAIALRPKLVVAMRGQLNALMVSSGGRQRMEAVVERALSVCPRCFQIRATYLTSLEPRWGGSHRAMAAFIASHPNRENPRLRLLPGYIDLDRAKTLRGKKDASGALAAVERALARGESWEFLLERARIHRGQKELEAALSDLTQAAALRPGIADVIYERADVLLRLRRWEEAGRDLRVALQLDPADAMGRRLLPDVVQGLVYAGVQRRDAGDSDGALERLDLAAELAPERRDVQQHRAWIVLNRAGPDAGSTEDVGVEAPVPDDFRAVQALDYRLARERQFERIVPLWDAFLARHPDHGQAHLERSGTLYHLRRFAEAREGASRACALGVSEGCLRAKQLANAR
jgi:tetratricopeptide (TPR) repeat protein